VLIASLCSRIWNQVKDVLCNDSPEGHLPHGLDDIDSVDTKDILSYSFRAIDESRYLCPELIISLLLTSVFSNLMRSLATKIKYTWEDGSGIIPLQVFNLIGELTFEQLSSLRHRGAFTTVALTFARCCQLTQTKIASDELMGSNILQRWYQVWSFTFCERYHMLTGLGDIEVHF
jgi:Putative death-receptor fusion protein (DUF2428)